MRSHYAARCLIRVTLLVTILLVCETAVAQNYRFRVPSMKFQAYVQPDASVRLEYEIVLDNDPGAHAIDIVDIGLPHKNYQLETMSASIDGVGLLDIRKSEYIQIGIEVRLGAHSIPAGRSGTFRFNCVMPEMVYRDTTDGALASLQIRPTWFDSNSYHGKTDLQIAIHALPSIQPEQLRYQDKNQRYQQVVTYEGDNGEPHPVAVWRAPEMQLSERNPKFAISFPRTGMQRVVTISPWGLFLRWFSGNTQVQWISGSLVVAAFALLFFRFSNGTGCVVFLLLSGFWGIAMVASPVLHLLSWPILLGLIGWNEWSLRRRKKTDYLPAMATVEGGGIKRGLTAPQASVLLELPLNKVLTMVVFGLLKKHALTLLSDAPPTVEVNEPYRGDLKSRLVHAAQEGVVLQDYEQHFLDALTTHRGAVEDCDLSPAMGKLVQSVSDRMQGFDLSATREYYQRIVTRAWKDAESIGDVKQREKIVDRNVEWMMIDPDFADILGDWARRGYGYRPWWSRPGRGGWQTLPGPTPSGRSLPTPTQLPKSPTGPPSSQTDLGEVAASFAGWAENTIGRMASSIQPAKMGLDLPGGFVDLSGVDRMTADVFEALAEASKNSGGGQSGGGGCACACAGCACACACAGGGR